ncbi:MAG: TraI domain-containing protein, partial [Burkholderiales bacterium]|nr:TraI domain-containing protein [Burkholderiales bacterium]
VSPVIEGYAEFVQLLPASQSQHHVGPGGLFTRGLEIASRALDYRRGQILPRGAAPEAIGAQAHRWTYAVFVAALLHDVGKTLAELRIVIRVGRGVPEPWSPRCGSMSACGAVSYRVEFVSPSGQDQLHRGLPVQLLNRFVPPMILEWLAEDPKLMRELTAFLAGDKSARTGAIRELVLRAAAQYESRDLVAQGRPDPPEPMAGQPDPPSSATNESAVGDEETEYLEDVDERGRGLAHEPRTAEPGLTQVPDAARRFIGWLQQGLSDGMLRFNEAGALVHFVDEGMLLVSPRIFREFAKRLGEDVDCAAPDASGEPDNGKSIQRQILRAGWHVRADKGVNILTYQVMRGDCAVSRLSGVVIRNPSRFVDPVPPRNPLLVRLPDTSGDA